MRNIAKSGKTHFYDLRKPSKAKHTGFIFDSSTPPNCLSKNIKVKAWLLFNFWEIKKNVFFSYGYSAVKVCFEE
jgi:hypothetical protein